MILAAVDANGFRCSNCRLQAGDYLIADCNGLVQGKSLFIHHVMQCNRSVNNFWEEFYLMPFRALQQEKMIQVKCDVYSFNSGNGCVDKKS